jgi:hypothetical protein
MTALYDAEVFAQRDEIVAPPGARACEDHSFELPSALFGIMAALFFGFMVVMAVGFAHPEMIVPMAIIFVFLIMFFGVPAIFVGAAPANSSRAMTWSRLMSHGVDTATGLTSGREAAVRMLTLPFLIFCWGMVVVAIAAAA